MRKQITFESDEMRIRVNIKFEDERLSISATGYERDGGRWRWSFGGQSYDSLLEAFPKSARLVEIWRRWHLNDLRAGDDVQETYLRVHGRGKDYAEDCAILERAGLLTHHGYRYGTAWKFEAVPSHIIKELEAM